MTRARIMRVNSRQKRVNQIRASFVKDARRQMRVDTRSLAGAFMFTTDNVGPQLEKVFLPPGTVFLRRNFPNIEKEFS